MAELLQHRSDEDEVLEHLEEAERRVSLACESIEDPITLNKLKEAEFTMWKIRAELLK